MNFLVKLSKSLEKVSIGGKFSDSEESSYAENRELENLVPTLVCSALTSHVLLGESLSSIFHVAPITSSVNRTELAPA